MAWVGGQMGWIGDCALARLVCVFICMYNLSVYLSNGNIKGHMLSEVLAIFCQFTDYNIVLMLQ